jgi:hypothetical protein
MRSLKNIDCNTTLVKIQKSGMISLFRFFYGKIEKDPISINKS